MTALRGIDGASLRKKFYSIAPYDIRQNRRLPRNMYILLLIHDLHIYDPLHGPTTLPTVPRYAPSIRQGWRDMEAFDTGRREGRPFLIFVDAERARIIKRGSTRSIAGVCVVDHLSTRHTLMFSEDSLPSFSFLCIRVKAKWWARQGGFMDTD